MINYCSVHVSRHTLDIHKCLEQTYESGNPFKIVDCNENLPYANPLKCYYDQKITFSFSSDFETMFIKHSASEIISLNFEKKTVNLNCNFPF